MKAEIDSNCDSSITFVLWLLALVFSFGTGLTHANEFVDTRESILKGLLEDDNEFSSKSVYGEKQIIQIKALTESPERNEEMNFTIVERSVNAPRVNLKVEFSVNSEKLRPSARELLDKVASALQDSRLSGRRLGINGHTDSTGSEEYNYGLSFRRALSVRRYLIEGHNIDEAALDVTGFGETLLISDDQSVASRQLNRRVELEVLK